MRSMDGVSDIKLVKDLALKSFFCTGPEGYRLELQQFTSGTLKEIFNRQQAWKGMTL